MNLRFSVIVAIFCAYLQTLAVVTYAEKRLPAMQNSMEYNEVISVWGSPSEKVEHESDRVDIWHYHKASVTFKEGRVVSWSDGVRPDELIVKDAKPEIKPVLGENEGAQNDPGSSNRVVEEILSEIMKDPSTSEGVPSNPIAQNPAMPGVRPQEISPVEGIN